MHNTVEHMSILQHGIQLQDSTNKNVCCFRIKYALYSIVFNMRFQNNYSRLTSP